MIASLNWRPGVIFGADMKEIKLTQGMVAIVDDQDFELVSRFKWTPYKRGNYVYAHSVMYVGKLSGKKIFTFMLMHRLIIRPLPKLHIDHKNFNGLYNRRQNLRVSTQAQNVAHSHKQMNTSSQYKGVHWAERLSKWVAQITYHRKNTYLGCYDEEQEAARAYNNAAQELFGEFALLNEVA